MFPTEVDILCSITPFRWQIWKCFKFLYSIPCWRSEKTKKRGRKPSTRCRTVDELLWWNVPWFQTKTSVVGWHCVFFELVLVFLSKEIRYEQRAGQKSFYFQGYRLKNADFPRKTVLHYAAEVNNLKLVELLIREAGEQTNSFIDLTDNWVSNHTQFIQCLFRTTLLSGTPVKKEMRQ